MKPTTLLTLASLAILATSSPLSAQYILPIDSGDGVIHTNANTSGPGGSNTGIPTEATGNTNGYAAFVGEYYAPGGSNYILPIQLPTLPTGDVFTSATLQTQLFALVNSGNLADADLYGMGTLTSPVLSATDAFPTSYYYQGGTYATNTNDSGSADLSNTLLQAQFLTPSSTVRTDANNGPFVDTSTAGSAALLAYLNAAYDNGANAGDYVFLRISYDQSPISGYNGYNILTEEAGGSEEKPQILYSEGVVSDDVPEPSSYAMLASGLMALAFYIRQRSKSATL